MKAGPFLSMTTASRLSDPNVSAPAGARIIDLPGATLMPGMIEGHSHLFLHPYNEKLWDDQVLHEPLALRTARAVVRAEKTLRPVSRRSATSAPKARGSLTWASSRQSTRDRPRASADRRDQGHRRPRSLWAEGIRAGSRDPARCQEASGVEEIVRAVRDQIARGANLIKFYADYRWGDDEPTRTYFLAG